MYINVWIYIYTHVYVCIYIYVCIHTLSLKYGDQVVISRRHGATSGGVQANLWYHITFPYLSSSSFGTLTRDEGTINRRFASWSFISYICSYIDFLELYQITLGHVPYVTKLNIFPQDVLDAWMNYQF